MGNQLSRWRQPGIVDERETDDDDAVHRAALAFQLSSDDGSVQIRRMTVNDLDIVADMCISVFNSFNASIGLPPEFPPREEFDVTKIDFAKGVADTSEVGFVSLVAVNKNGAILGANKLGFQDGVGYVGPIVSTKSGVGKLLMKAVMREAAERDVRSVRLLQQIPNTASFSLYLSLGFEPRRANCMYVGRCTAAAPEGIFVSRLTTADIDNCSALHQQLCGTARSCDIASAVGSSTSVARDSAGKLLGYTTGSHKGGHTVALSEEAIQAIIVAQSDGVAPAALTLIVPHHYSRLLRWLANHGFRLEKQLTSMSYGRHSEPQGYYLPSIGY